MSSCPPTPPPPPGWPSSSASLPSAALRRPAAPPGADAQLPPFLAELRDGGVTVPQSEERARRFECTVAGCGYRTDRKGNLKKHARTVHVPTDETRRRTTLECIDAAIAEGDGARVDASST